MTEQEKELLKLIRSCTDDVNMERVDDPTAHELDEDKFIKALIQRYPQILSEKVWEGSGFFDANLYFKTEDQERLAGKKVQVFIREVEG